MCSLLQYAKVPGDESRRAGLGCRRVLSACRRSTGMARHSKRRTGRGRLRLRRAASGLRAEHRGALPNSVCRCWRGGPQRHVLHKVAGIGSSAKNQSILAGHQRRIRNHFEHIAWEALHAHGDQVLLDTSLLPLDGWLQIETAGLILFESHLTRSDEPGVAAIPRLELDQYGLDAGSIEIRTGDVVIHGHEELRGTLFESDFGSGAGQSVVLETFGIAAVSNQHPLAEVDALADAVVHVRIPHPQ